MKTKPPTDADHTVVLSLADARALPNMLGRIAPVMLNRHGFYACTVDGVKTLYLLVPPYNTRASLREATLAVGRDAS